MSKKLPKATAQTFDDIRLQRDAQPKGAAGTRAKTAATKRRATAKGAARPEPVKSTPPAPAAEAARELREARAGQIVERFTAYSAVGSIIPIPLVDTLSVVLLIVAMVKSLADLYEAPFSRDRVRAAVAGVLGGAGQAGVGSAITAWLIKLTPGANMVGAAASSAASAVLTRTIGRAFVLHFETGGTALEFDAAVLRAHFERVRAAA
ncbi:DUF697 domain-containing protein [Shumkonia mesophila]|uniref:DUF697 domain-containing protein n=1 Tax=Shumkonia mesophila TaxID=2838854 RepID=UPI002934F336|nr:DUF697 domain-containing protein [Shumkonia mesophila]